MSIEILKQRRSIRKYETRQVPEDILDQILEAGTYAPTGMNRQSPVMVAVQDPEIIRLMEKENAKESTLQSKCCFEKEQITVANFRSSLSYDLNELIPRCKRAEELGETVEGNVHATYERMQRKIKE